MSVFNCLHGELARHGLDSCAPGGDAVAESVVAKAARATAKRAHQVLHMDAPEVERAIEGAWRAWRAYCPAKMKDAPYFSGFLNACSFGPRGELLRISLSNDYYPKWAPNCDHPIGPLGSGEEYGGMRALPPGFADVPARSVVLSNNFELDLTTLLNLPRGLAALHLTNVGLGGGRKLPKKFASHFSALETVDLSSNPDGWADAVARLPQSVKVLRLGGCGIKELPSGLGDLLPALEELDVCGNDLSTAAPLPRVPSLRRLVVTGPLPDGLSEAFPSLESLAAGFYGRFDLRDLEKLPATVRALSLPRPSGIFPPTCAGGKPFGVRELSLGAMDLSVEQFLALPPSLEKLSGCFLEGSEIPEGTAGRFPNLASFSAFPRRGFVGATLARLPASLREIEAVSRGWTEIPDVFSGHLSQVRKVDTFQNPVDPDSLLRLPRELRDLTCSGGPNGGESFPGRFAFPRGFKERCPHVESIDAAHHNNLDLRSLENVAPTLRRLRLAWCGTRSLDLLAEMADRFPDLEEIDLCGVTGGAMPPALAKKVAQGKIRILSYDS